MKSVTAVGLGVLIALVIGLLVVFGIFAPVLSAVFGLDRIVSASLPTLLVAFAAGLSFYWGGMAASYRAPHHRKLHGTLVAVAAFLLSPTINLASGKGPFPELNSPRAGVLVAAVLLISLAAAYVGARRGESLYRYNRRFMHR